VTHRWIDEIARLSTIGQVAERMTDRMANPTSVDKPRGRSRRTRPKQA
jgi:hypothetical protein